MKKTKIFKMIIALTVLCMLIMSCSKGENSKGNEKVENTTKSTEKSSEKKHLNMALYWFGENLDPALEWNGWTLTRTGVAETLVTVDEKMNFVGQLADSWENINPTTWKFHIRKGVTFQNGNPLTPEAVKSSIERSIKLNERGALNLKIANIKVDGEYVIFETTEPYGAFLANITEPLFVIVDTTADTEKFKEAPIGTGPYKVTSYKPNTSFEAVAYENYWGGKPGLDSITVFNIEDDNTRALALQSGEIDMAQGIKAGNISLFEGNKDYIVQKETGTRVDFFFMNLEKGILKDKNIRLAINSAINYEATAKTVGVNSVPAGSPFVSTNPFGKGLNAAKFDINKAKEYLTLAGYKDTDGNGIVDKNGKDLELKLVSPGTKGRADNTLTELIQEQLKQAGIKLNIVVVENFEDARKKGDFDLFLTNWQAVSTGDSQWFLEQAFKTGAVSNLGKYSNKELDDTITKLTVAFKQEERIDLTKKASQIIIDEAFGSYIISQANVNISNTKVENMQTFPIDYYFLTSKVTIKK